MAEFCNQCAKEMGLPPGDFAGITELEDYLKGFACIVVCEGCGDIDVDPAGNCVTFDCRKRDEQAASR
jgi:hypothetical protein